MPIIKVLYDNISLKKEFTPDWGVSFLIEYNGQNILFDAGADAGILSSNMKKMEVDPDQIGSIVISHDHWDHAGGLSAVLRSGQKVYLLSSFSDELKQKVLESRAGLIEISNLQKILPGVYTTGEMGSDIKEQALVIDTEKGLVVVTGCSHPGIVNIVRRAKEELKKEVLFLIGGFHLYTKNTEQIKKVIEDLKTLGIKKIAPCHCTGDTALEMFEKAFGKDFIGVGVGSVI